MIFNVEKKADKDRLDNYGQNILSGMSEIEELTNQKKQLQDKIDKIQEKVDKDLDKAYEFSVNNFGDCEGVTTGTYRFKFNVGESTIVPKTLKIDQLPECFRRVKIEADKTAIKAAYLANGKELPASLQKLDIKVEETVTIHCEEEKEFGSDLDKIKK